jgi:hypothetical protein
MPSLSGQESVKLTIQSIDESFNYTELSNVLKITDFFEQHIFKYWLPTPNITFEQKVPFDLYQKRIISDYKTRYTLILLKIFIFYPNKIHTFDVSRYPNTVNLTPNIIKLDKPEKQFCKKWSCPTMEKRTCFVFSNNPLVRQWEEIKKELNVLIENIQSSNDEFKGKTIAAYTSQNEAQKLLQLKVDYFNGVKTLIDDHIKREREK